MSGEFFDDRYFNLMFVGTDSSNSISNFLNGKSAGVRDLYVSNLKEFEVVSGTRVAFNSTIESVLYYKRPPLRNEKGIIVTVRTSFGKLSRNGDLVYVKWDSGRVMCAHLDHLTKVSDSDVPVYDSKLVNKVHKMKAASFSLLENEFFEKSSSELIHKATKDLWSFTKGESGDYVIERLFESTGEPLDY